MSLDHIDLVNKATRYLSERFDCAVDEGRASDAERLASALAKTAATALYASESADYKNSVIRKLRDSDRPEGRAQAARLSLEIIRNRRSGAHGGRVRRREP